MELLCQYRRRYGVMSPWLHRGMDPRASRNIKYQQAAHIKEAEYINGRARAREKGENASGLEREIKAQFSGKVKYFF